MSEGLDDGLESPSPSERRELIARALRLEWITLGWMLIEAAVAIARRFGSGHDTRPRANAEAPLR